MNINKLISKKIISAITMVAITGFSTTSFSQTGNNITDPREIINKTNCENLTMNTGMLNFIVEQTQIPENGLQLIGVTQNNNYAGCTWTVKALNNVYHCSNSLIYFYKDKNKAFPGGYYRCRKFN